MYLELLDFHQLCHVGLDSPSDSSFSQQRLDQSASTLTKTNHPIPSINDCDSVSGAESLSLRWSYTLNTPVVTPKGTPRSRLRFFSS